MRERETKKCRMVIFVSSSCIIEIPVGIRTDLDASERNLGTGVNIAVSSSADQGFDILDARLVICPQSRRYHRG